MAKSKKVILDARKSVNPASIDGYVLARIVPERAPTSAPVRLTGDTARRSPGGSDEILWDSELAGFGLRLRASGRKSWIVVHRRRGKQKWLTLGSTDNLGAAEARERAREVLRDAATDGLPGREQVQTIPTFEQFAPRFWREYADHWKPLTQRGNKGIIARHLLPTFGAQRLDEIAKADVLRWRDTMASKPCTFKNALPVLGVVLTYAEQLGFRPEGSNPCRGVPRFRRGLKERYLTPNELRRLGVILGDAVAEWPVDVALVRLLLYTGARTSEITSLRWGYVESDRLRLPDSKTGPKYVYLNRQAKAVLDAMPRGQNEAFIFRAARKEAPYRQLGLRWAELRSRAAIPDVRLHDLRHSFASVAINDNVPLATIGRLLGHELPETTARYAHLMDDSIADAANRVCAGIARDLGAGL